MTAQPAASAAQADTVRITVDGRLVYARKGEILLRALQDAGYRIPTLCHVDGLAAHGSCRMCVVEVAGARGLVTACSQVVQDGMVVRVASPDVRSARRQILELLLSNHPSDCTACTRSGDCELQRLAWEYRARVGAFSGARRHAEVDDSSGVLERDPDRCILCGRCVRICQEKQGVGAIGFVDRGFDMSVGPAFRLPLAESGCVFCGQCVLNCPTGALREADATERVWEALADPKKHVVVQFAPAVRVSLSEAFGLEPGRVLTGQIVAALRRMGFYRVFDTDFGADLTVLEEAAELVRRLTSGGSEGPVPLMTSCCPAWVKYVEHYYPDRMAHLSSCRSPHEMVGSVVKSFYAEQNGLDPSSIVVVSIMPCTAKKFEARRPELSGAVDEVLTTREFARMLRQANIDLGHLEPEAFDPMLGESTGAAVIFGSTGGVAEAALRTAYWMMSGADLPATALEFTTLHEAGGVRKLSVEIGHRTVQCAVADGLGSARRLLESPEFDKLQFIEVMACPGGCVGGGGQLRVADHRRSVAARAVSLSQIDRTSAVRRSHENDEVKALYHLFLGRPGSEKSHELLHTHYVEREATVPSR